VGLGKYALAAIGGGGLAHWAARNRVNNLDDAPPEIRNDFDRQARQ
jgi:hypothetical protein